MSSTAAILDHFTGHTVRSVPQTYKNPLYSD